MFGLSFWEIVVIGIVAIVVLGPKRLPELGKQVGKTLREFRRVTTDFRASMEEAADPIEKQSLPQVENSLKTKEPPAEAESD